MVGGNVVVMNGWTPSCSKACSGTCGYNSKLANKMARGNPSPSVLFQ